MNIDSSNILSLLSSDKGLDKLTQTLQEDNSVPGKFTDILIGKIDQINDLGDELNLAENFKINVSEKTDKQHDLAGLLNEKGSSTGLSHLFGKELPTSNKLENNIDLENTLEALAKVMHALEGEKLKEMDINTKLTSLFEKFDDIQRAIPQSGELKKKLSNIVDEFQKLNREITNNNLDTSSSILVEDQAEIDEESLFGKVEIEAEAETKVEVEVVNIINHLSNENLSVNSNNSKDDVVFGLPENKDSVVREKNAIKLDESFPILTEKKQGTVGFADKFKSETIQTKDVSLAEKDLSSSNNLTEHVDKLIAAVNQVEESISKDKEVVVNLERQIDLLAAEIETIKAVFYQQSSDALTLSSHDLNDQLEPVDRQSDGAFLGNQIAAILAASAEPLNQQKGVTGSEFNRQHTQQVRPEIKIETFSLKQIGEDRPLDLPTKDQAEPLLQQDIAPNKPNHSNLDIATLQNDKAKPLELKAFSLNDEKVALNVVTDSLLLNKSIPAENKFEIPPMTKHFANPEWNKEMGERIIWMHKQAIPSAELRLNPKHLGPIKIKLDVSQEQVSVAFTAQHAAVKDVIDASIPKLREMFIAQQLNLGEVNVSQENLDQKHSRSFAQMGNEDGKGESQKKDAENRDQNEQTKTAMEIVDEIEAGRAIASNGVLSIFA